jgi:hypothetical protein
MIETLPLTWHYTRFNPVKRGLVRHPADWPFCRFVDAWPRGLSGRMDRRHEKSLEPGERRRSNFDDCISFDQELPGVHCFAPIDQRNHALH